MPKKRIEEAGLCDERLKTTQDVEWLFRLLRHNENIFMKEPLSVVRLHESQGKRQINEFDEEQGEIHIHFLNDIDNDEVDELFGSKYCFLEEMASFYKRDNNKKAFLYAKEKFNSLTKPTAMLDAIEAVKVKLKSLHKNGRIVVFCAGKYGASLIHEMKSRDIGIDFIADNDRKKWGTVLSGIHVIPPNELLYDDLIIVAKENPNQIMADLKKQGYINMMAYDDIMTMLKQVLPVCIPN